MPVYTADSRSPLLYDSITGKLIGYTANDGKQYDLTGVLLGDRTDVPLMSLTEAGEFQIGGVAPTSAQRASVRAGLGVDRSFSLSSLGPARIVTLGASITNGSSSSNAGTTAYSPMIANSASHRIMLRQVVYKGHPGQSAPYIATQVQAALALKPDVLILGPDFGTNEASLSATYAGLAENYIAPFMDVLAACRAVGVRLVSCLTLPQGSEAADANTHIGIRRQNAWLSQVATKLGVDVIDTYTPMISSSTGYLNTSYYASGADPVHPNDTGHAALASAMATWIGANLQQIPWPAGKGAIGLNANTLMTGAGTTPDTWTVTVSPSTFAGVRTNALAAPVDATDLPIGRWYSVNCDASASGHGTLYTGSAAFSVTPGETLIVFGYIKSEGAGIVRAITWNVTATGLHAILMQPTNEAASKPFFHEITVPTGCTSMRLALQITTTAGQVAKGYIGACDAIRPSDLGY